MTTGLLDAGRGRGWSPAAREVRIRRSGFPTVQEGGHSFGPVPLVVDFQPPERHKIEYALSEAAQSVVVCYSSAGSSYRDQVSAKSKGDGSQPLL